MATTIEDQHIPDGDVVVATAWFTARPVFELSRLKGTKFYLIQHHETWDGPEEEVNATWHLPMEKIVISKWLQGIGEQLGITTQMRHIPNGIDFQLFRITTQPEDRPLSILSLYHSHRSKGVPDALAVLVEYHNAFPSVPISMFGTSKRGPELPPWITYFENPDQDSLVRDIYNQNAIYLAASIAEGWALPPAEAMACGCVFVGTDSGGCRDYAIHEKTALLSRPGDREGLLHNLIRVTRDSILRREIQRRGTENIAQFTWKEAGTKIEAYFADCQRNAKPEIVHH